MRVYVHRGECMHVYVSYVNVYVCTVFKKKSSIVAISVPAVDTLVHAGDTNQPGTFCRRQLAGFGQSD
jgi:hypothetical protein